MWAHPDAIIQYRASDMILKVHSDASYLSAPKARSQAGGYFFLGSLPYNGDPIRLNGAIHITCTILKLVAASAAEAELGALFLNAQEAKTMRLILIELDHPQPPTPIHIDNTTTVGIVNNTVKPQRSRVMEMRYFWLLDGESQRQFKSTGNPGKKTLVIVRQNIIQQKFISMLDHTMFTWINPPLSYQELSSQALGKGVLKSLGIPTPISPHYHVLGILLVCQPPQVSLTTEYLAMHESSTGYPHHTTILEEYH
jgi:hypothetical protein